MLKCINVVSIILPLNVSWDSIMITILNSFDKFFMVLISLGYIILPNKLLMVLAFFDSHFEPNFYSKVYVQHLSKL